MTYYHESTPGSFTLTGHDAELELTRTVIREVWKGNWPLISLYTLISLGSVGASYFTSRWNSVVLSSAVALATLLIGLFMAWKVITITITKTIR